MGDSRRQSRRKSARRQSKKGSNMRSTTAVKGRGSRASRISKYGKALEENVSVAMELTVLSVENLVIPSYPLEVCVCIYYDEKMVGMTQGVSIENIEPVELNFAVDIKLEEPTFDDLFALISKPIVVTLNSGKGLLGRPGIGGKVVKPKSQSRMSLSPSKRKSVSSGKRQSTSSQKSQAGKRKSQVSQHKRKSSVRRGSVRGLKSPSKTTSSKTTTTTGSVPSTTVIGKATIDILPIIQGESRVEAELVMEVPEKLQGADIRPYTTLPLVKVCLIDIDQISKILPPLANVAFFTVESMYNAVFTQGPNCHYYATIPIPLTPVEPNEDRELQLLHFENALVEDYVDINFRKKWYSISHSPGRTCLTSYRINYKFDDVKDQDGIGVDFTGLPLVKEPRVNWNSLRRMWFTPKHELFFKDTIIKYRLWPVEITVSPSGQIDLSERLKVGGRPKAEGTPQSSPPQSAPTITTPTTKQKDKDKTARKSSAGRKSVTRKSVAKSARKSMAKGGSKPLARKSNVSRKSAAGGRRQSRRASRKSKSSMKADLRGARKKAGADSIDRKPANPDIKHFVAYIDLSCLLFPGVKSTRAACRLMTYNQEDATQKWGLNESLMGYLVPPPGTFPPPYVIPSLPVDIEAVITPFSSGAAKPNAIPSAFQEAFDEEGEGEIVETEEEMIPEIHYDIPKTVPVTTENGRPVYVIVEVALLNPLVPKKTEEETIAGLKDLLTLVREPPEKEALIKRATTDFENCIMTVIKLINNEYKDYQELNNSFLKPFLNYDEKQFYGHLENSGALSSIQETLKDSITKYALDVVGPPRAREGQSRELLHYISNLYRKLVEDMYKVVNCYDLDYQLSGYFEDVNKIGSPSQNDLQFFAAEAREQKQYEKSKYYLLKRLEGVNMRNPDYWLDYAINSLRFGDIGAALEATKEALALNIRHKEGLLIYAVLLTMTGDLDGAEMFFTACTDFYPLFLEGWAAWYIFYVLTERADAADVTLILAVKTLNDLQPAFEDLKTPLLSWDEVPMKSNLFMQSALYFLRYNLYEFAEICLAKELERKKDRTLKYLYYLAVCHHLMGRYADSNSHLDEALRIHWENPVVWSLVGHNHYHLGNINLAMDAYNFVLNESTNEDDLHLIHLRKGFYYLDNDQPEEAKKSFLTALVKHQTPLAWLGLGMACYALDDIKDAEVALIESNALDCTMALSWAYLALVNLRKVNFDMFNQCMSLARKYGLDDENLLGRIEAMRLEILCEERMQTDMKRPSDIPRIFRTEVIKEQFSGNPDNVPSVFIKKYSPNEGKEGGDGHERADQEESEGNEEDDTVPMRDLATEYDFQKAPIDLTRDPSGKTSSAVSKFSVEGNAPQIRGKHKSDHIHRFDIDNKFANKDLD